MTFKKIREVPFPDLDCSLIEYLHEETGFRHAHLTSSFPELNFSLCLNTIPVDDTGMPHILEHLTLCGSEKYPVNDPFMAMLSRSVAHEMNAATGNLETNYHFATTILQDFDNLSDLYLDLIFNPLLRKSDFQREGWRLENQDNPELKGVVLNEMKGMYTNPGYQKMLSLGSMLAPNTPMQLSHGGHPLAIPHVSYERLCSYHSENYKPKNAVLATSGNIDIEKLHNIIEETLQRYQKRDKITKQLPIPNEAFYNQPKTDNGNYVSVEIPASREEPNSLSIGYLSSPPKNAKEELFDQMMVTVLFQLPYSPLQRLSQELGKSIGASYVFDNLIDIENKVGLVISVSNIEDSDINNFEEKIKNVWEEISKNGVSKSDWQSVVSSYKRQSISQKEESTHEVVNMISRCLVKNRDPLLNANNIAILEELEKTPPSLEEVNLWCQKFTTNKIIPTFMKPNPELLNSWDKKEKEGLNLLATNAENFATSSIEPKTNKDLLPILSEDNISFDNYRSMEVILSRSTANKSAHTHIQANSSNSEALVLFDMGKISLHDQLVWSLFGAISTSLGSKDFEAEKQLSFENNHGISNSWSFRIEENIEKKVGYQVSFKTSSLKENFDKAIFSAQDRTAGTPIFEEDRWKSVLAKFLDAYRKNKTNPEFIARRASNCSKAPYSSMANQKFLANEYVFNNLEDLVIKSIENPLSLKKEFDRVLSYIKTRPTHIISIGDTDTKNLSENLAKTLIGKSWNDLSSWEHVEADTPSITNNNFPIQSMINYCFRAFKGPDPLDKDSATVKVLLEMIKPKLHEQVREIGGAYGSSINHSRGIISMESYRDPNYENTYKAFDSVYDIAKKIISEQDNESLFEAKISILQSILTPKSENSEANELVSRIISNNSIEKEKEFVKRVLSVNFEDLKNAIDWLNPLDSEVTNSAAINESLYNSLQVQSLNINKISKNSAENSLKKVVSLR